MCQASPVRTHSDAPGDGQIILFISFGCCQCFLSTGWEIKFGCEGESQSSCLWSCQAQARQAANNLFDLKISFILLFGRGHWSSPFPPVTVALGWIIQQGEFSSGHSGFVLTEGFRAGIILCGLKTEETFGSEMPLNWNFSLLVLGDGQAAFFPSSGKDFYYFFIFFYIKKIIFILKVLIKPGWGSTCTNTKPEETVQHKLKYSKMK